MSLTVESLVQRGNEFFQREELEEAESAFNQAILLDPCCARAYFCIGMVSLARRDWEPASDAFDRAERLGLTDEPILYRSRAMASYFSGFDPEDRLNDADRLIALAPDDSDGWFYRGDALSDLGDHEAGIEAFNQAIALRPRHADAFYQRANAWESLGESEMAQSDYRSSAAIGSTDPNVYHVMGHYFESLNDYEESAKHFFKAVELEPGNPRHYGCGGGILQVLEAEGKVSSEDVENHFIQLERLNGGSETSMTQDRHHIYNTIQEHFGRAPLEKLELTERSFPARAMPDIQCAFDGLKDDGFEVVVFWATECRNQPVQQFSNLYELDRRTPIKVSNPRYTEFDIGEEEPFRALKDGVWLLRAEDRNLLVILDTTSNCYNVRIEVASPRDELGQAVLERLFESIETSIKQSRCYRGKILSMNAGDNYSGTAPGLIVHRIDRLSREQLILPPETLDLIDRNVLRFVRRREQLSNLGMSTKKGLLFYGPPGVGKSHTINYLTTNLPDHTTLLITGEQIGNLSDYMTLARLYAPSIVVIEDVDLIARHREEIRGSNAEVMLNKLLNEMDGIDSDAAVIFILTTNHPASLEEALASRPGRIDQAIEFPLPTAEGRTKLVLLYSRGITIADSVVDEIVKQTKEVSASFIKELMRRCVQFAFDRDENAESILIDDVDAALKELLVTGGSLNKKILGVVRGEFGFNQA